MDLPHDALEVLQRFFVDEYASDKPLARSTRLRDDLSLDFLGLEDFHAHLVRAVPTFKVADWDAVVTLGDVVALLEAAGVPRALPSVPVRSAEDAKRWFPVVIDRWKEKRQLEVSAVPMIAFYHAGGMVSNMRLFSKSLDEVTGPRLAVNPLWVELPGHGVRNKEALLTSARAASKEIAAVVASVVLQGDRRKPFAVFGHSVGTLHAYELALELEALGFTPRALVVLNRQAPSLPMDRPEDNFTRGLTDDQYVAKMASEYNQKTLLDLWKTSREMILATLPVSRADMTVLTEYRVQPGTPLLRCPVVCCASATDRPSNSEANVAAWRDVTSGPFSFRLIKGGHFAYTEDAPSAMPWIGAELQRLLAP